jgi:hypothetical protein
MKGVARSRSGSSSGFNSISTLHTESAEDREAEEEKGKKLLGNNVHNGGSLRGPVTDVASPYIRLAR